MIVIEKPKAFGKHCKVFLNNIRKLNHVVVWERLNHIKDYIINYIISFSCSFYKQNKRLIDESLNQGPCGCESTAFQLSHTHWIYPKTLHPIYSCIYSFIYLFMFLFLHLFMLLFIYSYDMFRPLYVTCAIEISHIDPKTHFELYTLLERGDS